MDETTLLEIRFGGGIEKRTVMVSVTALAEDWNALKESLDGGLIALRFILDEAFLRKR